ncbi:hypothetical protein QBC42DRAFT_262380 [Cladorrhinum samala]|uniref:DUF7708 domain-containing protein n=1 Tax=Cladorrhinum samala TaxID=585594 RepID=A0AAV9HY08_9PEZI|nr:hypothetical protein QBC42DRAFT_262380 [Cladorrhinum samala]
MALTLLYPDPCKGVEELLSEGPQIYNYVQVVTSTYMSNSQTELSQDKIPTNPSQSSPDSRIGATLLIADGDVKEQEDAFKAAMREYENTAKKKYKTGIDPDGTHTVNQLESIVSEAIEQHQGANSKGAWGKINLACRKLSEGKDSIEGWLGLLPSENSYLSIVCGGLKLILKAAARLTQIRDKILEALQQIPTILNSAQRVLNIYKDSDGLKSLSKAFYMSTLAVLGHILNYLRRKASSNILKVVFQPGTFQEDLIQKLDQVTRDRNAFNEEADICQKEMLDRWGTVIKQDNEAAREERARMEHLLRLAAFEQGRANRVIGEMLEAIKRRQSEMAKAVEAIKTAVTQPSNVWPGLLKLLQGGDGVFEFAVSRLKPLDTPKDVNSPSSPLTITTMATKRKKKATPSSSHLRKSLLSLLSYSPTAPLSDLTSLLSLGPLLPKPDQDRSLHLINSLAVSAWASSAKNSSLVINGNAPYISRTRSSVSFVTARLAFALEQMREIDTREDVIPLYFWAGLHYGGEEEWESPAGLVNSMLAQLLTKCNGLDLRNVSGIEQQLDCEDVEEVMAMFESVLKEVLRDGSKTIFVIIDGLSFWLDSDQEDLRRDAEGVITRFIEMGSRKRKKNRGAVKVLLTAPGRFHVDWLEDKLGENVSVLNIPVKLPPTGGYTAMKWEVGVERCLDGVSG